jgi:hypothetical protein
MPQPRNTVPLVYLDGSTAQAIATGNNAAWLCRCGFAEPLIGRSGAITGATVNTEVPCPGPGCNRRFFVVPDGYSQAAVLRVDEI